MRVAVVDPSNYTPFYCDSLSAALAARLDYVALVTSEFGWEQLTYAPNYELRYHFYRLGQRLKNPYLRAFVKLWEHTLDWARLIPWLRRARVDLVHLQWAAVPPVDYVAIHALRRLGLPVVYTAHNILPLTRFSGDSTLFRALYQAVDQLIVHTPANAADLGRLLGAHAGRISVVPHGPPFGLAPGERATARHALGLPPEGPLLLLFGNLRRYKGLEVLLEAFGRLRVALPGVHLLVAGRPRYAPPVALQQPGVLTDLRFIPQATAPNYYLSADVVVLPYRSTTYSGVLLGALALGRPVVVTDVGGLGETVRASGAGVVVPPNDADALFTALHALLSDPAQLRAVTDQAARWGEQAPTWEDVAAQTIGVYEHALNAPA